MVHPCVLPELRPDQSSGGHDRRYHALKTGCRPGSGSDQNRRKGGRVARSTVHERLVEIGIRMVHYGRDVVFQWRCRKRVRRTLARF